MVLPYPGDALGGGQDVHQLDVFHAVLLDKGDGGGGGAAGGQHGVQDDDVPIGDVRGHFAVVFHRLQGVRVPKQADVPHFGGGDEGEDALHHAQPRPENGDNGQLFTGQLVGHRLGHGGLHLHSLEGEVPGGVIAHEGGDFADNLPKILDPGGLIPQDGELVLQQGVIQYVYHFHLFHFSLSIYCGWGVWAACSRSSRSRSA